VNSSLVLITAEDDDFEVVQIVVDFTKPVKPQPIIVVAPANYDRFFKLKPVEKHAIARSKPAVVSDYADCNEIVVAHVGLISQVVARIKLNLPAHIDADDLRSVGIIGLIAAAKKFNPAQANTFRQYASMRIRGAILDELRRMDSMPRRARAVSRTIKEVAGEIAQELQREATSEEIAERMGVSMAKFEKLQKDSAPMTFVAMDQLSEMEDSNGASLHEMFADPDDRLARDIMEDDENKRIIAARLKDLPDIPRKILAMYYFEGMKMRQIADVFGLTESRICQIHAQTVQWLRDIVKRQRDR
jgi:RNA polymerase sigma factor FliA